jgi:hypothetical protein
MTNLPVTDALRGLNEILAPDGARLVVRGEAAGSLRLALDLADSECPECVLPADLLLDIIRKRLTAADPDLADIELEDPREPSAS